MRYQADEDSGELPLKDVANELGICHQRVSQLMQRAVSDFASTWSMLEYVLSVDLDAADELELAKVVRACRELDERLGK